MSSSEKPWFTYKAIEWLDKHIEPSWKVFEWGAGSSTRYFKRKCRSVITIEHDERYGGTHIFPLEDPMYVDVINDYGVFDLVSVDGRRRVECVAKAKEHAKRILLDNSDRERYSQVYDILKDWKRIDFHGEGKRGKIWTTTIWLKPE